MNLLKNISIYTLINFGVKAFGIIVLPIIAKNLSVELFGIYIILISIVSLSENFLLLGFNHSLNYFFYKEDIDKKELISTQFFFLIAITLLVSGIFYFIYRDQYSFTFFLLLWVSASVLVNFLNVLLRTKFDVSLFSISSATKAIVFLMAIYFFLVTLNYKLEGIVISNVIASISALILLLYFNRALLRFSFSIPTLRKIFIYGAPLIPVGVIYWANTQMDRYFILYYIDEYSLGIYGFALTIGLLPDLLKSALKSGLEPYIMKAHHSGKENVKELVAAFFNANLFLFVFVCLFISVFAKELVYILGDDKFLESVNFIPFVTLIVLINTSNQFFIYGINFNNKNNRILKYLIFTVLLNLTLSFLLIYNFISIYSLIISNIISSAFYSYLLYKKSNRIYKIIFFRKEQILLMISFSIVFLFLTSSSFESLITRIILFLVFFIVNIKQFFKVIRTTKQLL